MNYQAPPQISTFEKLKPPTLWHLVKSENPDSSVSRNKGQVEREEVDADESVSWDVTVKTHDHKQGESRGYLYLLSVYLAISITQN